MSAVLARLGGWLAAVDSSADAHAEVELLVRARRGDLSAFDEIVRRHQSRVYNLAYRMLRQAEDAEDVTQEAFLRAFEKLREVRDAGALGAWICRIAANLCLARLRRVRPTTEVPLTPELSEPAVDEGAEELSVQVRAALSQLTPEYRSALVAFYLVGCSYEEAARATGVGVRTLKTRLYRGRKRLRELLREEAGAMTCRQVLTSLQPHLDGALSGADARAVAAHLAGCASCAREFAALRRVDRTLAEEPYVTPPPHLRVAILARVGRRRMRTLPVWLDVLTLVGAGATMCALATLARGALVGSGLAAAEATLAVALAAGAGMVGLGALYYRA